MSQTTKQATKALAKALATYGAKAKRNMIEFKGPKAGPLSGEYLPGTWIIVHEGGATVLPPPDDRPADRVWPVRKGVVRSEHPNGPDLAERVAAALDAIRKGYGY